MSTNNVRKSCSIRSPVDKLSESSYNIKPLYSSSSESTVRRIKAVGPIFRNDDLQLHAFTCQVEWE